MQKIANHTLQTLHKEGYHLIQKRFDVFRSLVSQTKDLVQRNDYSAAAVYAEIAALYATFQHCGLFVSPELEQLLLTIGRKVIPNSLYSLNSTASLAGTPKRVLHVATHLPPIGGHAKMLYRWIQQDSERIHSIAITRQELENVPSFLKEAVNNSQGKIYSLSESIGSIISWAKRLREIATLADVVVLHTHQEDVIPIIAFANREQSPPIIYVNQADQCFWLGYSISDVVANLRESGKRLSQERRGIAVERNLLLPIILNPIQRTLSRTNAKQQLGLDEDSIVVLSIARALKFKTIYGTSYADVHLPVLQKYKQVILIAIGAGNNDENWSVAIEQTQGRIRLLEESQDTSIFYQAADIYVDTFPFVSNTSLLEAGSYGMPLVSRYPFSDVCSIIGADSPGLTTNLIYARDLEEYTAILSNLIEDLEFRLSVGEATRTDITEIHMGINWQHSLEDIYFRAVTLPRVSMIPTTDQMSSNEPDTLLTRIFCQEDIDLDRIIQSRMRKMPFNYRLHNLIKLITKYGFSRFDSFKWFTLLLPEWFYSRMKNLLF
ncbi:MAG: glycosyl transferase family 1 [Komarekiella atlantica HA4396-MV6]|jgi:hypothetical protein|nr:glycosyl transferase family 1 [Komarekiella atlantica HA4396-MV6]